MIGKLNFVALRDIKLFLKYPIKFIDLIVLLCFRHQLAGTDGKLKNLKRKAAIERTKFMETRSSALMYQKSSKELGNVA
jgi:hypothetical protein